MNKQERILNVINRKDVDYLPSQITFADRTRDKEISEQLGLASPTELDEYLGNHIYFTFCADDFPIVYRNDVKMMKELEKKDYCRVDLENGIVYDRWGVGIKMFVDGFFPCYHPLQLNTQANKKAERFMPPGFNVDVLSMDNLMDAVRGYKAPDVDSEYSFSIAKNDLEKYSGDYLVICCGYGGIYERGYHVMGWQEFMTEIAAQPRLIEELLDKIVEYKVKVAEKCVELGFKIGHIGDDLGNQIAAFFSVDMFKRIFKPRYAKIFEVYKRAGIPVAMYSCGNCTNLIPELIDIGLDILEPVQPCMDLKYLKKEFGKDLIFWGGIDTQKILPYGTPEEVSEMVKETIHTLGKGGGYIIAPSQEITKDVPIENIKALVETIMRERERVLNL